MLLWLDEDGYVGVEDFVFLVVGGCLFEKCLNFFDFLDKEEFLSKGFFWFKKECFFDGKCGFMVEGDFFEEGDNFVFGDVEWLGIYGELLK